MNPVHRIINLFILVMPIHHLEKIFKPRHVAVIGASTRRGSVGNTVVRNLVSGGFPGPIYPVNPKYESVESLKAYASVADLELPPDLAVICTPARLVPELADECGRAGIPGLVILSAGFREVGAAGAALQQELSDVVRRHDGLRVIGPNCLGIIAPHACLNASFAADMPVRGRIAFISQSGALCTAVLDWALQEHIGFSNFVSVGNSLDAGMADLIDYFATDENTDSIILYVESIKNAREFMSAARAFTRKKPIIAYKAGRFPRSAEAAKSHTGAMAGVDSVYEAAFQRAGIVRVREMSDMFDCAELLAREKRTRGSRVAIVTNAGGPGVMASDELLHRHGTLAELNAETMERLNAMLPSNWSHGNPIDVIGDATPERFAGAMKIVLDDPGVDAGIALFAPQAMSSPTEAARALIEVEQQSSKPLLTAWMGGRSMQQAVNLFNQAGVPTYWAPEQAVRAFSYLDQYARNRELLYETPRDLPLEFPLDRTKLRAVFNTILSEGHDVLTESTSKALLEAYEIPVSKPFVARCPDDAVRIANRIGYPVAMKIMSYDITHKTDVGGVALNLANDDALVSAYQQMMNDVAAAYPDARLEGVTIQQMVGHPCGQELILGAKRDAAFGTVLMVGAGGTSAELFQDRALELPPLTEHLARHMLESLRTWPLLEGFRGSPPVNVDRLIEILIRLSYLVADYPEIKELDVNPLLATPEDVIALDARIVLDHEAVLAPPAAYSHLAIRPYPHEFTGDRNLRDGRRVTLRPIKPEDEPLWHEMLASCSQESIWFRFRYLFKQTTHEMATRFCFIDYDREMAIVAETRHQGQRKLIGVGRLVADIDHTNAEYAVLVADDYQELGLGSLLTDYCLEICQRWNIRTVVAEVARKNDRMLNIFRKRDFQMEPAESTDIVMLRKDLQPHADE